MIEVTVLVPDPIVARLIRRLAERSRKGAIEYGHKSIATRPMSDANLRREKQEELMDYLVYDELELVRLEAPRGGVDE
tara:strand:- start:6775 stop:7008 length:234 start_codon:yes stop_codon:yes gene_type:complete